jgi:hypothetical protein
MKSSITLAAALVLSVLRAAAAEDASPSDNEAFLATPRSGQAAELREPAASVAIVRSEGSTAAVVLVFVMMTVIAYRRLDRAAP